MHFFVPGRLGGSSNGVFRPRESDGRRIGSSIFWDVRCHRPRWSFADQLLTFSPGLHKAWNMFENHSLVQVLKTLWKHCWTLSWQESRGVLPISGFVISNYKTKSLPENWDKGQTYFQAKGQFKMWITHKQNFREEQTSSTSPPAQAWPRPFRFPNSR